MGVSLSLNQGVRISVRRHSKKGTGDFNPGILRLAQRLPPINKTEGPFDLTGAQWKQLSEKEKTAYVEKAFRYWRRRGFPYYKLAELQMRSELQRLDGLMASHVLKGNHIRGSNIAVTLASSFHPQMWSVRVSRYMSPMDCFQDDKCLREVIRRAFTLWPDRHGANASTLRIMLKTFSNCAAVSNFRPAVAKAV